MERPMGSFSGGYLGASSTDELKHFSLLNTTTLFYTFGIAAILQQVFKIPTKLI